LSLLILEETVFSEILEMWCISGNNDNWKGCVGSLVRFDFISSTGVSFFNDFSFFSSSSSSCLTLKK